MVEVTENDRIAAKELISEWQAFTGDMTGDAEQAFATHREAAAKAVTDRLRDLPDDVRIAVASQSNRDGMILDGYDIQDIARWLADTLEKQP